jgi:hypothetical protein
MRLRTIDEAGLGVDERADVLWRTATRLFSLPEPA